MTVTTDHVSPSPDPLVPPPARLSLKLVTDAPGLLDGAWWPRSRDLSRELPSLVDALAPRWGRVTRLAANSLLWPVLPRKVPVNGHVVRVGWFGRELDPHGLLLRTGRVDRWDLIVVPPETTPTAAARLMHAAVDPHRAATASALIEAETGGPAAEAPAYTGRRPALGNTPFRPAAHPGEMHVTVSGSSMAGTRHTKSPG